MTRLWRSALAAVVVVAVGYIGWSTPQFRGGGSRKDSVLHLRLESFSLGLDPANILDTQSRRIIDMLHARLISEDARGNFTGELADRWDWVDPLTLRVVLKNGMRFSDERPVRAQDAAWSLCRQVQPGAMFAWLFSNIEHHSVDDKTNACTGIQAKDDSTLTIHVLNSPTRLLHALASSMGAVVPDNSKPGEYGSMVGAGAYRIDRIESNAAVHLVAWNGGPVKPGAARAVFRYIPDDATAAAQFDAGRLDVLEVGNPSLLKTVASARSRANVRTSSADTHELRLLIVNVDRLLQERDWSEGQVRGFVSVLRDAGKSPALGKVYGELGRQVSSNYFPARNQTGPVLKTNGEQLEAAPSTLQIISENDPYSELIVAALPKGIGPTKLEFLGLDKSLLIDRLLKKNYDIASITLEALLADPVYWESFFKPGSPFTAFGRPLPELDGVEADEGNIYRVADVIDQHGNWIVLFQERRLYLFNRSISGERVLPTGLLDFSRMSREGA